MDAKLSDFKQITIWENRRRVKLLQEFRSLVTEYFENVTHGRLAGYVESDRAREIRPEINKLMRSTKEAVGGARLTPYAFDVRGGRQMRFDFFSDIFRLREYNATEQWPVDLIDRALGIYKDDKGRAKFRTFNPFWWAGRIFGWVARTPFLLASAAGFDTSKVEKSVIGRIIRLAVWVAGAAAAIVTLITYSKS